MTEAPFTLRDATADDAQTILDVERGANREYLHLFTPGSFTDTVEGVRAMMAAASVILAVTGEGHVVGSVYYADEGDRCDLFRLAVLPTHRRLGIGRALVEAVEARGRAAGLPAVRLSVRRILPHNLAYYERLGYHRLPERTTETSWEMEKRL